MGFDFDDLEDAAPCGVEELEPMSDRDFKWRFAGRLRDSEKEGSLGDLATAFGEAIWEEEDIPARMPKIIEEFKALLDAVTKRPKPDIESGAAIAYNLWQISLSTSLHEVRVRPGAAGAHCALVLGFGGSGVDDLEGQCKWYHGQGFTTVSTTRTQWPPALGQKQSGLVAKELKAALEGGGRLVLHMCSHHGTAYGFTILALWILGVVPFDRLPPLKEALAALVFDCGPAPPFDEATKSIAHLPKDAASTDAAWEACLANAQAWKQRVLSHGAWPTEESCTELDKSEDRFYYRVLLGSVGALTKKWGVSSLEDMIARNGSVRQCCMKAARSQREMPAWLARVLVQDGTRTEVPDPFIGFQKLDLFLGSPVPRLFLYSEMDALVTVDRMEAYVRHLAEYNPQAVPMRLKLARSAHCRLWETEPAECAAAVAGLLERAGLGPVPARAVGS